MPIDAKAMSQVTKFNIGRLIRTVCFQDQQSISPIKLILLSQEKLSHSLVNQFLPLYVYIAATDSVHTTMEVLY